MASSPWLIVQDDDSNIFYRDCRKLRLQCKTLVSLLRRILGFLQGLQEAQVSVDKDLELQDLEATVELMKTVVAQFRDLTARKLPYEVKGQSSSLTGRSTPSSRLSYDIRNASLPVPTKTGSSIVFGNRTVMWRESLWRDRATLLFLANQLVSDIFRHFNNVAEQNHNHHTLENILRFADLYNELLGMDTTVNQPVSTWCRNTCPFLLHPLRKLSITKILQVLAQYRAEQCCQYLVDALLDNYLLRQPADLGPAAAPESGEDTGPENTDNSSLEVYKALTHHMTPDRSVLPPVEKVASGANGVADVKVVASAVNAMGIEALVAYEDRHVATLLGVAARCTPHLLGKSGVKPSKNSGQPRVSRNVRTKVCEYYQMVLWGEVGSYMEHVVLWWGDLPLGTLAPRHSAHLRTWLRNIVMGGSLPTTVVPAVQNLMDSLGCHVTSTSWDDLFRLTLVHGSKTRIIKPDGADGTNQGTSTGRLFVDLFERLVSLSNSCEVTTDWLSAPPLEDLPLVEQIPVLHRLDHSVHTVRLWATNQARQLVASWKVDYFFLVSHTDVDNCLQQLALLQLADHKDFSEVRSEHVMVCAKMRTKLVSELRDNVTKLKQVTSDCLAGMAVVCRTTSLANLHMCFPEPRYWRQNNPEPKFASPYVEEYLERVLRPVLVAMAPLPVAVQQSGGGLVMKLMCEAWLDHIYTHRIKFSEWGAVQLLTDFGAVPTWISGHVLLPPEVQKSLLRNEVLRRCEGVGRLLLRKPGEPIAMVAPPRPPGSRCGSPDSLGVQMMPAEMYVPNQEQWLELRAPKQKVFCPPSLCCSS